MCRRPVRGDRRPDAPQARAGAVSPGPGGATCPAECAIVGFARRDWTDENSAAELREDACKKTGDPDFARVWPQFASRIVFAPGTFDDPEAYAKLKAKLEELDRTHGTRGNRLYYLAVAPEFFATIIDQLGEAGPDLPGAPGDAPGAAWSSRSRSATTWPAPAP